MIAPRRYLQEIVLGAGRRVPRRLGDHAIPSLLVFTQLSAPPRRLLKLSEQVIWPVSCVRLFGDVTSLRTSPQNCAYRELILGPMSERGGLTVATWRVPDSTTFSSAPFHGIRLGWTAGQAM